MFRSLLAVVLLGWIGLARLAADRPNFVFFLVDDLGWADLGCYGSEFHETPHIDALAGIGMRFTDAYAASPVCSPTRASILTGKHPVRVNITDWIPGMNSSRVADRRFQHVEDRDNLALDEVTFAEYLRDEGDYQTFFLGKWHLGARGHLPTDQGFDINIGGFEKGSPPGGYYAPWNNPYLKSDRDGEYLTERLTDEAISLVEDAERTRPFLLYFSYYNVHTPIQPDRRTVDRFRRLAAERFKDETPTFDERYGTSRLRQDNPEYASMVAAVDTSVGRVLKAIDSRGLSDQTIVFLFSDNGGLCTLAHRRGGQRVGPTCNLPLRSGKGWLYEGGIREPLIIRAPGTTKPGSVCQQPVISADFFATIIELAGLEPRSDLQLDGISLMPLLQSQQVVDRPLYWHYPHYHGSGWRPGAAVRDGDWKLIEFYESDQVELYNLADDPGEQADLATQQPAVRDRLRASLRSWQRSRNASMPVER